MKAPHPTVVPALQLANKRSHFKEPTIAGSPFSAWGTLLLTAGLVSCGGNVVVEAEEAPTYTLAPGAAPPLAGCAAPRLVPAGTAWIGNMELLDVKGSLAPLGCEWNRMLPGRSFFVDAFFLDTNQLVNGCYASCLDEGECETQPNAPAPAEQFLPLRRDEAELFCAFRGGRLPSLPEMARATQAERLSIGAPETFSAWLDCEKQDYADASCQERKATAWGVPIDTVASDPADVGPFGHHDVNSGLPELTITDYVNSEEDYQRYCEWPQDVPAPQTFGPAIGQVVLWGPSFQLELNIGGALANVGSAYPFELSAAARFATWNDAPLATVRCAYDAIPE